MNSTTPINQLNVLVTGCAGFIGWKVSEFLLREGHTVTGVDNLNDAYDVRLKEWRLHQIQDRPNFQFHQIDITDHSSLEKLFAKQSAQPNETHEPNKLNNPNEPNQRFNTVINLAARAGVRQSLEDPWAYYETNVTGTLNLLELCKKHEVKKFILASTSSVYGESERPFREDVPANWPLSPYAATKKAAEALAYSYHYLYGIDVTVLRYFTVYGPAGRPDMSIFRFIKWIAEGEPVVIYGDGTQERDFTCVDDVARGTLLALKPLGYEVINLGSDRPLVLRDVVSLIEKTMGKRANIKHQSAHPSDVPATWADISKAREHLGWQPNTSFADGLQAAIDWYRENREWAKCVTI